MPPTKAQKVLKENLLTVLTIVGVLGGATLGIILRYTTTSWTQRELMYLAYPGELFLRMLKCLIVPLLVSSITSAIGSLDVSLSGRIAARSFIYYFTTTFFAVILGIVLVTIIEPGKGTNVVIDTVDKIAMKRDVLTQDTLMDLIRNLVPPNIIQATFQQYQTQLSHVVNVTLGMF